MRSMLVWAAIAPATIARGDDAPTSLQFTAGAPEIGQRVELELDTGFDIASWDIAAAVPQIDRTKQRVLHRRQLRILEVAEGVARRAEVRFVVARYVDYPVNGTIADRQGLAAAAPIEGNSYDVERDGEELVIRRPDGELVDPASIEGRLVASAMQGLGLPNWLGRALAGRTVAIGETVALPPEAAQQILGAESGDGAAMELTLSSVKSLDGATCGVFDAVIERRDDPAEGGSLRCSGEIWIDAATTRPVAASLSGRTDYEETVAAAASQAAAASTKAEIRRQFSGSVQVAVRTRRLEEAKAR